MENVVNETSHVSVVIPNYNGRTLLQQHFNSVLACLEDGDEIIVVDDASTDTSVTWLCKKFELKAEKKPNLFQSVHTYKNKKIVIKLLVNFKNMRFGKTCNNGVRASCNDFIFLLNTDVTPIQDCRNTLIKWFTDPKVFAVGCLEYENDDFVNASGKNKIWFAQGIFWHSRASDMRTGATGWVSGGSGMFRKSVWEKLNGFDEAFYPAYWEDIDLSWRAKKLGYKTIFDAHAIVLHRHETTNASVFKNKDLLQMSWKSADTFAKKHADPFQLLEFYIWRPYWWWKRWRVLS